MDVDEWIQYGFDRGFCSPSSCETHEGPELTEDEIEEFSQGYDPCVHIVRLWPR